MIIKCIKDIGQYIKYISAVFHKMSDLMYFRDGQVIKRLGVGSALVMYLSICKEEEELKYLQKDLST